MEELERETPLFDREVPVILHFLEKEDKHTKLTVRVMHGTRQPTGGQRQRLLHVELTDEMDPFFLFTLDVTEEDFHALKQDQNLRVDFSTFPSDFIALLESCIEANPESVPRFQAVLNVSERSGSSVFSVVEITRFKDTTHLALCFIPGNDGAVKKYLAARLFQTKSRAETAEKLASEQSAALQKNSEQLLSKNASVKELTEQRDQLLERLQLDHQAELTTEKQRSQTELWEMQQRLTKEKEQAQQRAQEQIASLQERLVAAEERGSNEGAARKEATQAGAELGGRLQMAEAASKRAEAEVERLRSENKALESNKFELEKSVSKLQMSCAGLEQQVRDKTEVVGRMEELLRGAEDKKNAIQESLQLYKNNQQRLQEKLEASIREITKGNRYIERLHAKNTAASGKLKLKTQVLQQQEKRLGEQAAARQEDRHRLDETVQELLAQGQQLERARQDLEAANASLREKDALLQKNEKVVGYLNGELNKNGVSQLHQKQQRWAGGTSGAPGSLGVTTSSPFLSTFGSPAPIVTPHMDHHVPAFLSASVPPPAKQGAASAHLSGSTSTLTTTDPYNTPSNSHIHPPHPAVGSAPSLAASGFDSNVVGGGGDVDRKSTAVSFAASVSDHAPKYMPPVPAAVTADWPSSTATTTGVGGSSFGAEGVETRTSPSRSSAPASMPQQSYVQSSSWSSAESGEVLVFDDDEEDMGGIIFQSETLRNGVQAVH